MGGWESVEMVQRYAHLAPEHLSQHARLIDSSMPPGIGLVQNFAKVQNQQNADKQLEQLNQLKNQIKSGGSGWSRTSDQRIMSPLL